LAGIVFPLGLHCELDGAAAERVGSSGFLIDGQTAAHDYRGFSGTVARRANADRFGGGSPNHRSASVRVSIAAALSRSISSHRTSSGLTRRSTLLSVCF
jgi:hypothetical protein